MITLEEIIYKIIKEQESVIGPIAWEEARMVKGLHIIDKDGKKLTIDTPEKEVLSRLVAQYERLFGRASIEVCRDAVRNLLPDMPPEKIPEALK